MAVSTLFMFIMNFLPYKTIHYRTSLTASEVQARLSANVITGMSFLSEKPYYGEITPYDFSVRKTYSRLKKQSMSPTVDGRIQTVEGQILITLTLKPHMIFIVSLILFSFPCIMFLFSGLSAFFKTWDFGIFINCFVPLGMLYSIFYLIFHIQSSAAFRFWEYTLALQPIHL
ncbi:hypothetical protein [Runella sp.]|uniref:hypothetical protein n=1 Tax=Runella sp. TaxID=1960881 RepID=UPI003D0B0360